MTGSETATNVLSEPVIGICAVRERARWSSWDQEAHLVADSYVASVQRSGAIAMLLPVDTRAPAELIERIEALLLIGGADLDPGTYGEQRDPATESTYRDRDEFEIALLQSALEHELPVLGICRGMQILNVALGGTLEQNLIGKDGSNPHRKVIGSFEGTEHTITLEPGSLAARAAGEEIHTARCHHHQAVLELGEGLVVSGRAADGVIEAIETADERWVLGVQWHPEADERSQLFAALRDAAQRYGSTLPHSPADTELPSVPDLRDERAALQQKDNLCGPFHVARVLRAAGVTEWEGEPLDQDLVALRCGTVLPVREVGPQVPPGAANRRDYRYELTLGEPEESGTRAQALARAVEELSAGRLSCVPLSGHWSETTVERLLQAGPATGARLIANVRTGALWSSRPPLELLLAALEGLDVPDPPAPEWDTGHFIELVHLVRGRAGALVLVCDSYPSLGWMGHHLQPPSAVAAALMRGDGRGGGVLAVVARGEADAVRELGNELGLDIDVWDN